MKNKELKRFSRKELLEILVFQGKEIEELKKQLEEANRKLNERKIMIEEAGSIAEAALRLNDVFRSADEAAKQYIESLRIMKEQEKEVLDQIRENALQNNSDATVSDDRRSENEVKV